jgi:hypothetical protein
MQTETEAGVNDNAVSRDDRVVCFKYARASIAPGAIVRPRLPPPDAVRVGRVDRNAQLAGTADIERCGANCVPCRRRLRDDSDED